MFNRLHLFLISFISLILFTPAQSNTYSGPREGYDYIYQANLFSNTQGEFEKCDAMKPKPSVGQSFGPCQRTQDASIFAYQYSIKWDNKDTVSWSSPIIGKCDTKQGWVRVTVGGKAACERPKNVCYSPMVKAADGTCKCPTSGGSFGSTGCDKGCSVSLNMDLTNLTHSFEYSGGKCTVGDDNGGDDSDTDTPPTDAAGNPVSNYTPSPGKSCASGYGEMKMGDKRKCVKEGDAPSTSACPLGQMMYKGSCKTFTEIMNDGDTGGDTGGGTGGDNGGGTGGGTGGDTGGGTGGDNGGGTGGDTGNCPEGQKCDDEGGGGPISGGSLPAQSKLYTQKYPGGIVGVWKNTAPTIANTKFGQGLSNMFPTFGSGSCPNWSIDLNFGNGMNFGSFGFDIPCWVFQACGLIILATAAFTARKIIF